MILHQSHDSFRSIAQPARERERARIGLIGFGSIVALLIFLNLTASLA